jgi:hypothetical protein
MNLSVCICVYLWQEILFFAEVTSASALKRWAIHFPVRALARPREAGAIAAVAAF